MGEKFWGFLDNLSKEARLFILFLSIVLAIISLADSIPILGISFPLPGKVILLLLALLMFGFSMRSVERSESSKLSNEREINSLKEQIRKAEELKENHENEIKDLEADLKAVHEIIINKNDQVSHEIANILVPRLKKQIEKEELSPRKLERAHEWVRQQAKVWSSKIQRADIQDGNLSDEQLRILRDEIIQYIYLFGGNLLAGLSRSPRNKKFNIPQTLGSSLIYRQAMMCVQRQMEEELENLETKKLIGGHRVGQELRKYMSILIDDI